MPSLHTSAPASDGKTYQHALARPSDQAELPFFAPKIYGKTYYL